MIKTFENFITNLLPPNFRPKPGDSILDILINSNIDESKIIVDFDSISSGQVIYITYEKDNINYKLKRISTISEFGADESLYFFQNDISIESSKIKMSKLFYLLYKKYINYLQDIKKYNL